MTDTTTPNATIRRAAEALDLAAAVAKRWLGRLNTEDAMEPYSAWYGDWSDYHGNYRWQRLGGGHRAHGDCLAVIDCLKAMARPSVYEIEEDE